MDEGEEEVTDQYLSLNPHGISNVPMTMDTFLDDFLKNSQTCTHTHTCNPPGPDAVHTHTCYHTHTQVFTSEEDDGVDDKVQSSSKSRRPSGNRAAVRKYREKKKAHTAYLEDEVKKLRVLNQQLARRLQGQAKLEAELLRLRALLLDLRGKVDVELGVYCNPTSLQEDDCRVHTIGLRCETNVPCLHPQVGPSLQTCIGGSSNSAAVNWEGSCAPATTTCQTTPNRQNLASTEANHVMSCHIPQTTRGR